MSKLHFSDKTTDGRSCAWARNERATAASLALLIDLVSVALAGHALKWREGEERLKRCILAMLAGWIAYFCLINLFARALNKVAMPVLGMPLGLFLAVQGTMTIFGTALFLLARYRGSGSASGRRASER